MWNKISIGLAGRTTNVREKRKEANLWINFSFCKKKRVQACLEEQSRSRRLGELDLLFPVGNLRLHHRWVLLHVRIEFQHIYPENIEETRWQDRWIGLTNRLELSLRMVFALPKAFSTREEKPECDWNFSNEDLLLTRDWIVGSHL